MSSSTKPQERDDIENINKDVIWMKSEKDVKSEANRMKEKLNTTREKYRTANYTDVKGSFGCNKKFIEWNEDLLSFCKANRRKYHMESQTVKLDQQRLEDQRIIAQKEEEIEKLQKELQEAIDGKDQALNRLSEIQSHLLKSGNPEITDLGDKNRPTNLGERYKELYDNEWTDTFEFLTEDNGKEDKQAIAILYNMLQSCSKFCSDSVSRQYQRLAGQVTDPLHVKATTTNPNSSEEVLHGKVEVAIKEFSKGVAEESLKNIDVTDIVAVMKKEDQFTDDILQNDAAITYIEKTFKLCWLMQTQHPPMLIDFTKTPDTAFDTNVFDSYTVRGPNIEQIVWPPVFLHEDGPLVGKGVAQGTKE